MTAEELLRVPDVDGRHELIAGELITLSLGGMARGLAGMVIGGSLGRYVDQHALGVTLMSAGDGSRNCRDSDRDDAAHDE